MLLQIKKILPTLTACLILVLAGCSDNGDPAGPGNGNTLTFNFDFQNSDAGFRGGFADFAAEMEDLELLFQRRKLPPSLDSTKFGLYLSGRNSSDDLFMFAKKRLNGADGIKEDVVYRVTMVIQIATPEASGCIGAGGAPGEAQHVKAGVTMTEPMAVLDENGFYEMNILKGQQISDGQDMKVIGHVGNSSGDCTGETWEFKTLTLNNFLVQTDERSTLWLIAGTDSGYEGINRYYFTNFSVTVQETNLDSLPAK